MRSSWDIWVSSKSNDKDSYKRQKRRTRIEGQEKIKMEAGVTHAKPRTAWSHQKL